MPPPLPNRTPTRPHAHSEKEREISRILSVAICSAKSYRTVVDVKLVAISTMIPWATLEEEREVAVKTTLTRQLFHQAFG